MVLLRVQRNIIGFTLVLFRVQRKSIGVTVVVLRVKRKSNGFTLVLLRVQRKSIDLIGFASGSTKKHGCIHEMARDTRDTPGFVQARDRAGGRAELCGRVAGG